MILKISVIYAYVAKNWLIFVPLELNPYGHNSTKLIVQRR